MAGKDAGTPRVYLARHGETEWSRTGHYTGTTELDLTENGEKQVKGTGKALVGSGKLVDPARLARVFVSPRKRAQDTFDILFGDRARASLEAAHKIKTTETLAEWGYGQYEGLLTKEIRDLRQEHGLDRQRPWDIWTDGCEDGETPDQVTTRLDRLVEEIQALQAPNMHGEQACDVLLVAHGHILRAFVKRWLKYPMHFPLSMMLEPGGIGALSYQHHSVVEPAILVGIGFPIEPSP